MKNNIKEMTLTAIFMALIIMMATVPFLGYIQIGAVSLTIIHIPVIVGILLLNSRRGAVILGLTFGLTSFFVALTRAVGPVDLIFQNPLVSVLPRLLFGLVVFELFNLFNKYMNNKAVSVPVTAVVSTFLHTIFVLVPLYYVGKELFAGTPLFTFIYSVVTANAIFEMIAAGIIVPLVYFPVMKYRGE